MGMGADLIEEFLNALRGLDIRGFRQFFPVSCFPRFPCPAFPGKEG